MRANKPDQPTSLRSAADFKRSPQGMKTICMIFCSLVIAVAQSRAEDDETTIYKALEEVVDATFECQFEDLASRMHPQSLRHFRKIMGVAYDRLAEKRGAAEVLEVIGLSDPPAQSKLSDKDLFVALARRAKELDPTFIGSADLLPIKVHGTVFGADGRAFVVYEYTAEYSSKKSSVGVLQPLNVSFKKLGEQWLLYSTYFSTSIPRTWAEKLVESRSETKTGEQGGTGQPATRSESDSEGGDKPQSESEGRSR